MSFVRLKPANFALFRRQGESLDDWTERIHYGPIGRIAELVAEDLDLDLDERDDRFTYRASIGRGLRCDKTPDFAALEKERIRYEEDEKEAEERSKKDEEHDAANECWRKLFDARAEQQILPSVRGPITAGRLTLLLQQCNFVLADRADLSVQEENLNSYHVGTDGFFTTSEAVDRIGLLPPTVVVGSGRLRRDYPDGYTRYRELSLAPEAPHGHYVELSGKLLRAARMKWYGFDQIENIITRLERVAYTYIKERQDGFDALTKLAPLPRAIYDWEIRYPGNGERFVSLAFGNWDKMFASLRTCLQYRERDKQNADLGRGNGAIKSPEDDRLDERNSMLQFENTLREMNIALLEGEGVYDRDEFEANFDLHWHEGDHVEDNEPHGPVGPSSAQHIRFTGSGIASSAGKRPRVDPDDDMNTI